MKSLHRFLFVLTLLSVVNFSSMFAVDNTLATAPSDNAVTVLSEQITPRFRINIYVKYNGKYYGIQGLNHNSTIRLVKEFMKDITGIEVDRQVLMFAGKALDDQRTLADYYISKESTLELFAR